MRLGPLFEHDAGIFMNSSATAVYLYSFEAPLASLYIFWTEISMHLPRRLGSVRAIPEENIDENESGVSFLTWTGV